MELKDSISQTQVSEGEIAIFYLAQAGFCFKTASGALICMDPYFSNCCEREFGFKRLIQPVIGPKELKADIFVTTHAHFDHLDIDALPTVALNPNTFFIGAPDCREFYLRAGLSEERFKIIAQGESCQIRGIDFRAIYADHGELAPEAVGILITVDGIKIYNAGDTGYQPEKIVQSLGTDIDVMIAPINGAFGNMDHVEACRLADVIGLKVLIASHFGMFVEHGGEPEKFLAEAEERLPGIASVVLARGGRMIYSVSEGIKSCERME